MNPQLSMYLLILLSTIGLLLLAWNLGIFRDPAMSVSILRMAIGDRGSMFAGSVSAMLYALVFLIFGGQGGRVHIIFGRWIFNTTAAEAVFGIIVMLLVALTMTLFTFNIKILGLTKAQNSGLGIFGTALAMLASFCP